MATRAASNLSILHLCAKNDRNGNPRRCYVTLCGGSIVRAYDEGYKGYGAVPEELWSMADICDRIEVTPATYRDILKRYR